MVHTMVSPAITLKVKSSRNTNMSILDHGHTTSISDHPGTHTSYFIMFIHYTMKSFRKWFFLIKRPLKYLA